MPCEPHAVENRADNSWIIIAWHHHIIVILGDAAIYCCFTNIWLFYVWQRKMVMYSSWITHLFHAKSRVAILIKQLYVITKECSLWKGQALKFKIRVVQFSMIIHFWLYFIFSLSLRTLSGFRIELSRCNALYIRLKNVILRFDWIERVIQIIVSEFWHVYQRF